MPLSEIIRSLFGIWRLFLLDKHGAHFFDNTHKRTIRSFAIPFICYTFIVFVLSTKSAQYEGEIPFTFALIVQTLGFAISLCGYLIFIHSLTTHLKKSQEFMRYVQINNWMALIALFLILPVLLISAKGNSVIQFLFLMLTIFRKIYEWFVIQTVFKIQWYWILFGLLGGEIIDTLASAMAYTIIY